MDFLLFLPLLLYVVCLFIVTLKLRDIHSNDETYFFAGRKIHPLAAWLSVIATETSVATVLVFPAEGYTSGWKVIALCTGYVIGRGLVCAFYLKRLHEQNTSSIYDVITSDSGALSRRLLEGAYLLAKYMSSGVRFFLGAYGLSQLLGGPIAMYVIGMAGVAGLYGLSGGLRAVVVTDQIQGVILFLSGIGFALYAAMSGSYESFTISSGDFFLLSDIFSGSGSFAFLIGGIVISIGSHGTDQDLLQRILGVGDFKRARWALFWSGPGAAVVILLFTTCGVFLARMHPALALNPKSPLVDYIALSGHPLLIGSFAVLLMAAAMSTIDSAIHSTATIWKSIFLPSSQGNHSESKVTGNAESGKSSDASGITNRFSPRQFSFLSLLILTFSGLIFEYASKETDNFLSLALGAMNYVYGGLIGLFTCFVLTKKRASASVVVSSMLSGFFMTILCNAHGVSWTWTALFSSTFALLAGYLTDWISTGKQQSLPPRI